MTTASISSTGTSTSSRIRPTEEPFFAVPSGASPFCFFCPSSGSAAFSPAPCLSPLPPDFSPLPFLSAVSMPAAPGEALGDAVGDALGDAAGEFFSGAKDPHRLSQCAGVRAVFREPGIGGGGQKGLQFPHAGGDEVDPAAGGVPEAPGNPVKLRGEVDRAQIDSDTDDQSVARPDDRSLDEDAADLAVEVAEIVDPFDAGVAPRGEKNPASDGNSGGTGDVQNRLRRSGERREEGKIDAAFGGGEKLPAQPAPAGGLFGGGEQRGGGQTVHKRAPGVPVGGAGHRRCVNRFGGRIVQCRTERIG